MKLLIKKPLKLKAQAMIEGPAAFLISFLIFIFIIEFALYFKAIHSNQTFADDISANIATYHDAEKLCSNPDDDILNLIEERTQKYLDKNIKLSVLSQSPDLLILDSNKNLLHVNIICSQNEGYIVRSEYLFKGFFALRLGHQVLSISSVQTPKF